jgi:hypothetical protein
LEQYFSKIQLLTRVPVLIKVSSWPAWRRFFLTKHTIVHCVVTCIFQRRSTVAYIIILVDDEMIHISKISLCKNDFPSKCKVSPLVWCLLKQSLELAIVLGCSFLNTHSVLRWWIDVWLLRLRHCPWMRVSVFFLGS